MKKILLLVLFSIIFTTPVIAESEVDPFARDLLHLSADAELKVPTDSYRLIFQFELRQPNFAAAQAQVARLMNAMKTKAAEIGAYPTSIDLDWDLIQQSMISLNNKNNSVKGRIILAQEQIEPGAVLNKVAQMIDSALILHSDLSPVHAETYLSDELHIKKSDEVLLLATARMEAKMWGLLKTLGQENATIKRFYSTAQNKAIDQQFRANQKFELQEWGSSAVTVEKPFRIESGLPESLILSASVYGIYEIE